MESSAGAATDLRDALALFDWRNAPRMGPEQLERHYVKRTSHRTLRRVLKQLGEAIRKETHLRALYMGPAGCGKSTDLTWVTQEIADEQTLADPLMVLHYDIGDSVGWHDVGFAELALSLALKIHERFKPGLNMPPLDGAHLRKINEWIYGERARPGRHHGRGSIDATCRRRKSGTSSSGQYPRLRSRGSRRGAVLRHR